MFAMMMNTGKAPAADNGQVFTKRRGRPPKKKIVQDTTIPGQEKPVVDEPDKQPEQVVAEPEKQVDVSSIEYNKIDPNACNALLNKIISDNSVNVRTPANQNPSPFLKTLANDPEIINAGKTDVCQAETPVKSPEDLKVPSRQDNAWNPGTPSTGWDLKTLLENPVDYTEKTKKDPEPVKPVAQSVEEPAPEIQETTDTAMMPEEQKQQEPEPVQEPETTQEECKSAGDNKRKGRRSIDYINVSKYLTGVWAARQERDEKIIQQLAECVFTNMLFHKNNKYVFVRPELMGGDYDTNIVVRMYLDGAETDTWGPDTSHDFLKFDFIWNLIDNIEISELFRMSLAAYCGMTHDEWKDCVYVSRDVIESDTMATDKTGENGVYIYVRFDKRTK